MQRVVSPLRYPGSKARLVHLLASLLERNLLVGSHMYEPFAGGAAASLNLLANGFVRSATWIERDPLVYAFWRCVKDDPEALIARMRRGKVTLAAWKQMQRFRAIDQVDAASLPALGYAGLFFNRTCFSGVVGAGPIGGMNQESAYKIDCRFNKNELAKAIRSASKILDRVELHFGDGVQFLDDGCLQMKDHSFVYIDPPYVSNGYKLYRFFLKAQIIRIWRMLFPSSAFRGY